MVARERMRVADLEAELREFASEREALKLAMKVLEEENQRFRDTLASDSHPVRQVKTATPSRRLTPSPSRSHGRHSSSSSVPYAAGSAPDSPHANLRYLAPVEPLPSVGNGTCPPLEVECWPDSPTTPYYTSALPETAEPDEGETTARLITQ